MRSLNEVTNFALLISSCDWIGVKALIKDGKRFETFNGIKSNKSLYLSWLKNEFKRFKIESPSKEIPYEFDRCTGCEAGKTVVIFDEGRFPKQEPNSLFRYTAWNIIVEEGFITGITFCHSTVKLRALDDYSF